MVLGFPCGSDSKESTCNVGYLGSTLGQEDPLKEGMAIYSGILAWRIPWTEEPGELQSMGLKRVGHDRVTNTFTFNLSLGMHQSLVNLLKLEAALRKQVDQGDFVDP